MATLLPPSKSFLSCWLTTSNNWCLIIEPSRLPLFLQSILVPVVVVERGNKRALFTPPEARLCNLGNLSLRKGVKSTPIYHRLFETNYHPGCAHFYGFYSNWDRTLTRPVVVQVDQFIWTGCGSSLMKSQPSNVKNCFVITAIEIIEVEWADWVVASLWDIIVSLSRSMMWLPIGQIG